MSFLTNKCSVDRNLKFSADLVGSNVIPANASKATATFSGVLNACRECFDYVINAHNLEGITWAEIHLGKAGKNGPLVKTLCIEYNKGFAKAHFKPANHTQCRLDMPCGISDTDFIKSDSAYGKGTWTAYDYCQPLTLQLMKELQAGNLYVIIKTYAFPKGEIRGQIKFNGFQPINRPPLNQ